MTTETALTTAVALLLGLVAGFALARLRPARAPAKPTPVVDLEDDTKPTLVPFRATREAGLARIVDRERENPRNGTPDQLDALLADLDRRNRNR